MKSIANQINFISTKTVSKNTKLTQRSGLLYFNEKKSSYLRLSIEYKNYSRIRIGTLGSDTVIFLNNEIGNKITSDNQRLSMRSSSKGIVSLILKGLGIRPKGLVKKELSLEICELCDDHAILKVVGSK